MRPTANFTFHAILAAAIAALASSAAAAARPMIDNEGYVWLPGKLLGEPATGQGERLNIRAFRWGSTEDSANLGNWAKAEGLDVTWDVAEYRGVSKVDSFTVKQGVQPADPRQHGEWVADVERPAEQASKERRAGSSELEAEKDSSKGWYAPGNTKYSSVKLSRGAAGSSPGSNETLTVGSGRTESGLPTGKRLHKPFVLTRPAGKGSVWVRVASPWTACRVGIRFPWLELRDGGRTYRLEGASVANCGRSGPQASAPIEEVAFTYQKISFN